MNADDIKQILSETDITNLMMHLGSGHPVKSKDALIYDSICHNGDSKKLYYYPQNQKFHCYTSCGQIGSIFDVVSKVLDLDFSESFKYVCDFFNIRYTNNDFSIEGKIDNSFIKKFKKKKTQEIILKNHNINVLNYFEKMYHKSWIDEHITVEAMKKFNIRYDILENRIIIPHFDIESNLVGIRARNLNSKDVEMGKKYMPIYIDEKLYNYPTHANLYGIHINRKAIERTKTVIILESEKAVLQLYSYYGEECVAVACSGSSIGEYQIKLLQKLGVENVILALDKDYEIFNSSEEQLYRRKIKKAFIDKLIVFFNIEIIWDMDNFLGYKNSPTDKGKDIFEKMLAKRLII